MLAGLRFGNVVLLIQPPRGFGENPIAIYHDPDLPPSHHYLAAYRWLAAPVADGGFGADAVVHMGKHGTLEWLPGKGLGLAADCAPDAVLGDLPLVYPFIVNDPGEGTQAKRRAHAVVVDHLVPPMARAETYGDLAKLEQLLDEYATVQALDPAKVPTVRAQIWDLVRAAQLHHDLHAEAMPDADDFDDFVLHIDGYLCEVKDVQIRDGLHILADAPTGEPRVNLVLAVLRAPQIWGGARRPARPAQALAVAYRPGRAGAARVARAAAGAAGGADRRGGRAGRHRRRRGRPARGPRPAVGRRHGDAGLGRRRRRRGGAEVTGRPIPDVAAVLHFAATELVPRLGRTTDELTNTLGALDGGSCRPARPVHPPGAWSTCCPPAATSTPSTRRPSPAATPGTSGWPSRTRCSPGTSPTPGRTPARWV